MESKKGLTKKGSQERAGLKGEDLGEICGEDPQPFVAGPGKNHGFAVGRPKENCGYEAIHLRPFLYTDGTVLFSCLPPLNECLWGKHIVCEFSLAGDDSVSSVTSEGLGWPSHS